MHIINTGTGASSNSLHTPLETSQWSTTRVKLITCLYHRTIWSVTYKIEENYASSLQGWPFHCGLISSIAFVISQSRCHLSIVIRYIKWSGSHLVLVEIGSLCNWITEWMFNIYKSRQPLSEKPLNKGVRNHLLKLNFLKLYCPYQCKFVQKDLWSFFSMSIACGNS